MAKYLRRKADGMIFGYNADMALLPEMETCEGNPAKPKKGDVQAQPAEPEESGEPEESSNFHRVYGDEEAAQQQDVTLDPDRINRPSRRKR